MAQFSLKSAKYGKRYGKNRGPVFMEHGVQQGTAVKHAFETAIMLYETCKTVHRASPATTNKIVNSF